MKRKALRILELGEFSAYFSTKICVWRAVGRGFDSVPKVNIDSFLVSGY